MKAAVSKTAILSNRDRGFESHPLRQLDKAKFGSPADFRRKIEFVIFVPRSGTPEAGFSNYYLLNSSYLIVVK